MSPPAIVKGRRVRQRGFDRMRPHARPCGVRVIVLPVEEALAYKLFEHNDTGCFVKMPETACLASGQTQTWHFRILTTDASQ
jgi:hypothetical protein